MKLFLVMVIFCSQAIHGKDLITLHQQLKKELHPLVLKVSRSIKYGNQSNGLSPQSILKSGIGHCLHFNMLLSEELRKLGIPNRHIGNVTYSGPGHAIVEVNWKGTNIVADPTLGIIYPYSYFQLINQPELADKYIGKIPSRFKIYAASRFFSSIKYFQLPQIGFMTPVHVLGPPGEVQQFKDNKKVQLKWDAKYKPLAIFVHSSLPSLIVETGQEKYQRKKMATAGGKYFPIRKHNRGKQQLMLKLLKAETKNQLSYRLLRLKI